MSTLTKTSTATATATATAPPKDLSHFEPSTQQHDAHVTGTLQNMQPRNCAGMAAWNGCPQPNPTLLTVDAACDALKFHAKRGQTEMAQSKSQIQRLERRVQDLVDKLEATQTRLDTAMDRLAQQDHRVRKLEREVGLEDRAAPKRQRTSSSPSSPVVHTYADSVSL